MLAKLHALGLFLQIVRAEYTIIFIHQEFEFCISDHIYRLGAIFCVRVELTWRGQCPSPKNDDDGDGRRFRRALMLNYNLDETAYSVNASKV